MKSTRSLFASMLAIVAVACAALLALPAQAQMSYSTTVRSANMTDILTAVGSGGKMKWYGGCTRPSGVSSAGGCTLLATLTWSGAIGTVTSGVLDLDEASAAQTSASHVSGTPVFTDFTNSGDTVAVRIPVCGSAPCVTFTGTIATGQNVTLTGITITAGNP